MHGGIKSYGFLCPYVICYNYGVGFLREQIAHLIITQRHMCEIISNFWKINKIRFPMSVITGLLHACITKENS